MSEREALQKELADKRRERAQLQARKQEEAEIARLRHEAEAEEHISDAIERYGAIGEEIAVMHTNTGSVIVRKPDNAVWRRFSDGDELDGKAIRTLVVQCLVWPSQGRFDEIIAERPAALEQIGGLVNRLAAVGNKDAAEK